MDDNKVAVLLENLSSQFKVFGEGLEIVQRQVSEVNQKVDNLERRFDGLERKVDGLEKKVDGLIEDMDMVKPALVKINNRLDTIEGEIIKLNPDSRAAFVKQAK